MKKVITFLSVILLFAVAVQAQKKDNSKLLINKTTIDKWHDLEVNFPDSSKPAMFIDHKSDTLEITRVGNLKAIKIGNELVSIELIKDLGAQLKENKLPLYVTLDWVAINWQFIKKATNPGLNDDQMDLLKQPLIPWIQYLQKLQEQQAKKQ